MRFKHVAVFLFFALNVANGAFGQIPSSQWKAIAKTYRDNVNGFSRGTISFRMIDGDAPDLESALSGRLNPVFTGKGFYAFSGNQLRYEIVYSEETLRAATQFIGENKSTSRINSFRRLTDGERTLFDQLFITSKPGSINHSTHIDEGSDTFYQGLIIPLGIGRAKPTQIDLDRDFLAVASGTNGIKVDSVDMLATLNGKKVARVKLLNDRGGTREFWIDLAHGAIPLKLVEQDKRGTTTFINDDIRNIDGRWLPYRSLVYFTGGRVKDLVVDSANFSSSVEPSAFQLKFDEPQAILESSRLLRHAARTTWTLKGLPTTAGAKAVAIQVSQPPQALQGYAGPKEARRYYFWLWIPCLIVGLVLSAMVYRSRGKFHAA